MDRRALVEFVVDNPELEQLEALVDQFNIFEALGAVRQELRHSDFLAFLLDPTERHGLGDLFVRRLLQRAVVDAGTADLPVSPIDLDVWDLDGLTVRREWQNIDILLEDPSNRFVVVIENKVTSSEHSEQLQRYRAVADRAFPDSRILHLFLTPEGDPPTDDAYIPISYVTIAGLVEDLVKTRASVLGPDVGTLLTHYADMLRRHIVRESEIADLARQIYRKHKHALDVIFEHKPDLQADIRETLEALIREQPGLLLDHCSKSYIRFCPEQWDTIRPLALGQGWTRSKRLLLFEFDNSESRLALKLIIGPGIHDVRAALFEAAKRHGFPFYPSQKILGKSYQTIFVSNYLTAKDYGDSDLEDLNEKIRKKWNEFVTHTLPEIRSMIEATSSAMGTPRPSVESI